MGGRNLRIRFLSPGERQPRATMTFVDRIPDEAFDRIARWAVTGEGTFGRARKNLTINVIVTRLSKREVLGA
jgi:hypothetical protein